METVRPRLIDSTLDAELAKTGYVKIPEVHTPQLIEELKALYAKYHVDKSDRKCLFWNSMNDVPTQDGFALSAAIMKLVKPQLDKILIDYESPLAQIMSKNYGKLSDVNLHRDTTIFDEDKYTYLNIWIPLVDANEETGGMFFIPGSHKVFTYPKIHVFSWQYQYLINDLMPYTRSITTKAGDVVIYMDRTLHGSFRNQTQDFRPVVFLGAMHPNAQIQYYYYDAEINQVRVYAVPHDFYFQKNFSEPTQKYPVVSSFDYAPYPFSSNEAIFRLEQALE